MFTMKSMKDMEGRSSAVSEGDRQEAKGADGEKRKAQGARRKARPEGMTGDEVRSCGNWTGSLVGRAFRGEFDG